MPLGDLVEFGCFWCSLSMVFRVMLVFGLCVVFTSASHSDCRWWSVEFGCLAEVPTSLRWSVLGSPGLGAFGL